MKTCPNCHRTYADDTMAFCLDDGSLLSTSSPNQATQGYPPSRDTAPATQVLAAAPSTAPTMVAPPPASSNRTGAYQSPPNRSRWPLILGAIALLAVAGVILAVVAGVWLFNRDTSTTKSSSRSSNAVTATPTPGWNQTENQPAAKNEAPPQPTPAMSGVWVGKFDEYAARLTITETNRNSFVGDISGKTFEIIIEGDFDSGTRAVTFRETRVIRDKEWVLGTNFGTMSADGQKISGRGKANSTYSWSFTRQ